MYCVLLYTVSFLLASVDHFDPVCLLKLFTLCQPDLLPCMHTSHDYILIQFQEWFMFAHLADSNFTFTLDIKLWRE